MGRAILLSRGAKLETGRVITGPVDLSICIRVHFCCSKQNWAVGFYSLSIETKHGYCNTLRFAYLYKEGLLPASNKGDSYRWMIAKYSQLQPTLSTCSLLRDHISPSWLPLEAGAASKNADCNHQDSTTIIYVYRLWDFQSMISVRCPHF